MVKKSILLIFIFSLAFFTSCGGGGGGSGSGGGGGSQVDVSGTWSGTGIVSSQSDPTTLVLSQSGNSVSGTWDGYAFIGSISGNQLTLTLIPWTEDPYSYTGRGDAIVSGNIISGTFYITATRGELRGLQPAHFL